MLGTPQAPLCSLSIELYAKQAILTKLKKVIVVVEVFLIPSIISSF